MRQVIYQLSREFDPRSLIPSLEEHCQREGMDDIVFQDLVEVLPEGRDKEWAFSCQMGDHVGTAMIGRPYAIIWNPSPLDRDWFARLDSEGYSGKKILVHCGLIGYYRDMVSLFGRHADYKIEMVKEDMAEQICSALSR